MSRKISVIVCWTIIALICVLLPLMNALHSRSESLTTTAPANPPTTMTARDEASDVIGLQTEIAGKYAVGVSQLDKSTVPVLMTQLHQLANTPAEKLAVGVVISEVNSPTEGASHIAASGSPDAPAFLDLLNNAAPLPPTLAERYGFFARLAESKALPNTKVLREQVIDEAKHTVILLSGISVGLVLLCGLGFLLLVAGIVLAVMDKIRFAVDRPRGPAHVYVEAFTLWIVIYLGGSIAISKLFPGAGLGASVAALVTAFTLFMVWPMIRGVPWALQSGDWGLTLHRPIVNVCCGVLGYLAGLPVLGVGLLITLLLMRITGVVVTHPITTSIGDHPYAILLLAAVFAPITEETLFRGGLLSHLRGRLGPFVSAAISGLVFAAIHPQGWAGIPVIGSIGFVLAMIRQWRGSLLASMTAHALNNGAVILAALALQ